jgi:hypothetical protein
VSISTETSNNGVPVGDSSQQRTRVLCQWVQGEAICYDPADLVFSVFTLIPEIVFLHKGKEPESHTRLRGSDQKTL